jgi:hypothetical protein
MNVLNSTKKKKGLCMVKHVEANRWKWRPAGEKEEMDAHK